MGLNTLGIVLVGIADKKDDASSSTNEMYLDCEAFLAIHRTISREVFKSISTCKSAHEVWTKLEDIYGGSNLDEDDIMMNELVHELFTLFDHKESTTTSISDCLHTSASSISQGNDMLSDEIHVDENVIASMDTSISSTTHSVNYCADRFKPNPKKFSNGLFTPPLGVIEVFSVAHRGYFFSDEHGSGGRRGRGSGGSQASPMAPGDGGDAPPSVCCVGEASRGRGRARGGWGASVELGLRRVVATAWNGEGTV
ncbi:hypothetical protein D1007_35219 [Hordeum vulgare]|nr:hypothetical protein D1007_35219 [Hordeum vulgare]